MGEQWNDCDSAFTNEVIGEIRHGHEACLVSLKESEEKENRRKERIKRTFSPFLGYQSTDCKV